MNEPGWLLHPPPLFSMSTLLPLSLNSKWRKAQSATHARRSLIVILVIRSCILACDVQGRDCIRGPNVYLVKCINNYTSCCLGWSIKLICVDGCFRFVEETGPVWALNQPCGNVFSDVERSKNGNKKNKMSKCVPSHLIPWLMHLLWFRPCAFHDTVNDI